MYIAMCIAITSAETFQNYFTISKSAVHIGDSNASNSTSAIRVADPDCNSGESIFSRGQLSIKTKSIIDSIDCAAIDVGTYRGIKWRKTALRQV